MMRLSELVRDEAVVPRLSATDRNGAIEELVDRLLAVGVADASARASIIQGLLAREEHSSTGFGKGVAVPHVKHQAVQKMSAAIGLSEVGIDFNSLDRQPVFTIVLLLSPEDDPDAHLQAMEVIFKNLTKETFRRFLRQARTVEEVRALLEEADAQQLEP